MSGDHLVAHQLLELGNRDFERGVDLVGGLIAGPALGVAGPPEVVHGAREPRVGDGQEPDVGPGHRMQRGGEEGDEMSCGERVQLGDEGGGQGRDGLPGNPPLPAPGVHRGEQRLLLVRGMAGSREQLRHPAASGRGVRGLGRSAGGTDHASLVRHRIALAQRLHRQVPHDLERSGQAGQVGPAQARDPPRLLGHAVDRPAHVHGRQVGTDGFPVRRLRPHPARLAHPRRSGMGVSGGKRLVREPRVGDEAPGSGGVHHVATPEGVDTQDGVRHEPVEGAIHSSTPTLFLLDLLGGAAPDVDAERREEQAG